MDLGTRLIPNNTMPSDNGQELNDQQDKRKAMLDFQSYHVLHSSVLVVYNSPAKLCLWTMTASEAKNVGGGFHSGPSKEVLMEI